MPKGLEWYARYPAHYAMDTVGLSLREHGAYVLLLDRYYHDGELEADVEHLLSMCQANATDDQEAVRKVIKRFFKVDGAYLKHKRVEEELAIASAISAKRKKAGKAGGLSRALNQKNNEASVKTIHNNTVASPVGLSNSAGPGGPRSAGAEHPEKPVFQAIASNPNPDSPPASTNLPEKSESSKELKKAAKEILGYLNQATGKKFHEVDSNLDPIVARLKEGATPVQVKSVILDRVQAWGTDEKMSEFLRPDTLFRRSKFWNYMGNITALDSRSPAGVESTSPVLQKSTGRQPGEDLEDGIPF